MKILLKRFYHAEKQKDTMLGNNEELSTFIVLRVSFIPPSNL